MRMAPVIFSWQTLDVVDANGEMKRTKAMVPLARFGNVCARQYADGEEYPLVILEARSRASHSHFFAALQDGFDNLPHNISARWPTADHLRRWLLVETGWFDEKEFDCDTKINARRLALFIRTEDSYARISVHETKVIVRRAKSQSMASMGKEEFQQSKTDTLDLLESMLKVEQGSLMKNAGTAA